MDIIHNWDVSLEEFKEDYLKEITRNRIIITRHGKLRVRSRQHFTDEEIKDILLEKFPVSLKKNDDGEFELEYNCNKEKNKVTIILVPHDPIEKSIRLITTYS